MEERTWIFTEQDIDELKAVTILKTVYRIKEDIYLAHKRNPDRDAWKILDNCLQKILDTLEDNEND